MNLRYTMINENLKKMSPRRVSYKGKNLKKKNMVSNDSKSPNSARNKIKFLFEWRKTA